MKFKIHVEDDASSWWEPYDKDVSDAQECAEEMIAKFNRTLRPNEKPRRLLEVVLEDSNSSSN